MFLWHLRSGLYTYTDHSKDFSIVKLQSTREVPFFNFLLLLYEPRIVVCNWKSFSLFLLLCLFVLQNYQPFHCHLVLNWDTKNLQSTMDARFQTLQMVCPVFRHSKNDTCHFFNFTFLARLLLSLSSYNAQFKICNNEKLWRSLLDWFTFTSGDISAVVWISIIFYLRLYPKRTFYRRLCVAFWPSSFHSKYRITVTLWKSRDVQSLNFLAKYVVMCFEFRI